MSAHPLLPLRLSVPELWTLHHVLLDRLEQERRSPSTTDPPPIAVFHAFERIEAGDYLFTPTELHAMRLELERYLERAAGSSREQSTVAAILDRVAEALGSSQGSGPSVRRERRTRPR